MLRAVDDEDKGKGAVEKVREWVRSDLAAAERAREPRAWNEGESGGQ